MRAFLAGESALTFRCWLPVPRQEAFDFLGDARHLARLTPPWFRLLPLTPLPVEMEAGRTIDYLLRWRRWRRRWRSRVVKWDPPRRFTYEQERGPYRWFRHAHLYRPLNGGTQVVERVSFAAPGGWLAHKLVVEPDLRRVFAYRERVLLYLFAPRPSEPSRLVVRRGGIESPFEADAGRWSETFASEESEQIEVVPGHLGP